MQLLANISLETFLNIMEKTPHGKHFLFGDSKPNSGMALAMLGLTMTGYGHKQTCSQIGHKYWCSFKTMQYQTLRMGRKLTMMYFKVVSCSIL